MKLRFFLLINLVYCSLVTAQSFKYRNYIYEWPSKKPDVTAVSDSFKREDAVILEEKLIYNQGGNKIPGYYFVNFSANYAFIDESFQGITPVIQKYLRIKFLTEKGIKKFSKIILPESFDQQNDYYSVRPQWRDSIFRPLGGFECIRYFAARIIKPDGTIKKPIVDEKTRLEIITGYNTNEKYYNWIFQVKDLQVGDELELDYSYEGVYNYSYSNRIFFNAEIPIQKLDATFRYPEKKLYILTYHNGAFPNDSLMVTPTTPHYTEYYFHFNNLSGGINEPGGRPYIELPFISFYEHRRDYGIVDSVTKYVKTPLPYPWSYAMLPYAGYKYDDVKLRVSRMDKSTVELNNLTEEERKKSPDTSAASILSTLQNDVAENYDFKEDEGYYRGVQPRDLERFGKNIENKTLRQMSRMRLYDEVLTRLDKPYYHSLLIDKRISEVETNRYETLTGSRTAIALPYKDYIINFYPKSTRFGYESNEIPFYYEDTYSFLIPQNVEAEKKYELVPRVEFKFVRTPSSSVNDNQRNTAGMINISFDSMHVQVNSKIRLTGQFSTLIRGFYKYGVIDTTVNPDYYNLISTIADDQSKVNNDISAVNPEYPFDIKISQKFSANNILRKTGDKEFSIILKNMFNNITEEDFHSDNRHLEYFPDFQSQDNHRYFIHFDHKIKVDDIDHLQQDIENKFAKYELKISQPSETDILIESNYIVKVQSVPAIHANDVELIFNAIHSINASTLKINKID